MEIRFKLRLEAFERAVRVAKDNPITPSLPRVASLTVEIDTIIHDIHRRSGEQDYGHATYRSGSAIRAQRASELRGLLRSINRIALALDPEEFPGLKQKLKMPRGDGYELLRARAAAFVDVVTPIWEVFTERGLDIDLIEQITAKGAELQAAKAIKNNGRSLQVGGTAGLADLARRGMRLLRELDAILTHQYRADFATLAAWKGAVRIHRNRPTAARDSNANAPSMQAGKAPELPSAHLVPSSGQLDPAAQLDTFSVPFRVDGLGKPPVQVFLLNNDFLLSQPIRFIPVSS
jgi:hypothetical protein